MKLLIKLGGSVITKKYTEDFPVNIEEIKLNVKKFVNIETLKRLIKEIKNAKYELNFDLVLVNGAGPFGHFLVDQMVNKGNKKITPITIHESVKILNLLLVSEFKKEGLELCPIEPFVWCRFKNGKFETEKLFEEAIKCVKTGFIPSTYGDIVKSDEKTELGNYKIISGDDLIVEIANRWKPNKIILVSDVDGVFDKNPRIHEDAKLLKVIRSTDVNNLDFNYNSVDVTGAMGSKIKKIFKIKCDAECRIINGLKQGNLYRSIIGDDVGTLVILR